MQRLAEVTSERERSAQAAQERRDRYAAIVADAYRRQRRWSADAVADMLGYNVGLFRRRMQPFEAPSFAAQDIPVLTEVCGDELLRTVCHDCGGAFLPYPEADGAGQPEGHTMTLQTRLGELAATVVASLDPGSDGGGTMTPNEAERADALLAELMREGARLQRALRARADCGGRR